MKIRSLSLIFVWLMIQHAESDVILALTSSGSLTTTTVQAGQTFTLNVYATINSAASPFGGTSVAAFDLYLNTAGTDSSGDFSVAAGGVTLDPAFSFILGAPDAVVLPASGSSDDLGSAQANGTISVPVTHLHLEQLAITVNSQTLPGIYSIDTSQFTDLIDNNGGDNFQTEAGMFTVTVDAAPVPEPDTGSMLLMGLVVCAAWSRVRKSQLPAQAA